MRWTTWVLEALMLNVATLVGASNNNGDWDGEPNIESVSDFMNQA